MFGSVGKKPQEEQKPLGLDARRSSTNQEARPVPWFAGKQRLGLTFISDVFKEKAVAVTQTVGKQKTKSGDNFYASFGMAACVGPVDGFHDIYLNDDSVYASEVKIQASSLTGVAGVATFTTKNAHGLATGSELIVDGAKEGDYNGSAIITVTGPKTFTYPLLGSPSTPATGSIYARLKLDPILRVDEPDPVNITIPDYGTALFAWGTADQPVDALLNSSGIEHPPYRGISKITFDQLFFGFNQMSVQNIELTLSRAPVASWHALEPIDEDANPVAAICDFLQHPLVGIGLRDEQFNQALMIAAGEQLKTEGMGISPFIDRQQSAAEFLSHMLDHIEGSLLQDAEGKLYVHLNRAPASVDVVVTDADTTARVRFTPPDWTSACAITEVKFSNRDRAFKDDVVRHRAPEVFAITGERNKKTLDLPFITKRSTAVAVAKSAGRINALPSLGGSAKIRLHGTLFDDLAPGNLFSFNLSTRDTTGLVFRVSERTLDDQALPEFAIKFQVDRSYLFSPPAPATLTVDADTPTVDSDQHTSDQETI